jgi:transposase-like protein
MTTDTKLTSKQAFWLEHIQAITRTGQSLSAYAQSHGLNVKQLYYWNKVLRQRGHLGCDSDRPSSRLFQKARVVQHSPCRILLPTGVILELDTTPEPAWLGQLLGALA